MRESNVVNAIRFWSRYQPAKPAIVFEGETVSWQDFDRRTDELAAGLQKEFGIAAGDRVAILAENSIEWCEIVVATLKVGGLLCPLNTRLVARELEYIVEHSGTRLIICDETYRHRVEAIQTALGNIQMVEIGTQEFKSLRIGNSKPVLVEIKPDMPALLPYTSGTTGLPKGVILSHGNIWANGVDFGLTCDMTSNLRALHTMPLAFTNGVANTFLAATCVHGGALYLLPKFDAKRCLDLIVKERINHLAGATIMFEQMMLLPEFKDADLSCLKTAAAGATVVHVSMLKAWQEKGVDIRQAYGLTENSGACLWLPGWAAIDKPHTVGFPFPNCGLRVVNDEGKDCKPGEPGEILLDGPMVMMGYWNDPEATKSTVVDGWLHTGDMGVFDEQGFLAIVDRKKDMIISGGINTYPAEIEQVIYEIAGVVEVAVVGVPDEKWGETAAAIIRASRDISVREVIDHCNANMADYKVPRYVVFVTEAMPRTMSGKLQKNRMRAEYADLPNKMKKVR